MVFFKHHFFDFFAVTAILASCSGSTQNPSSRSGLATNTAANTETGDASNSADPQAPGVSNSGGMETAAAAEDKNTPSTKEGVSVELVKTWDDLVKAYPIDPNDIKTMTDLWVTLKEMSSRIPNSCSSDADCDQAGTTQIINIPVVGDLFAHKIPFGCTGIWGFQWEPDVLNNANFALLKEKLEQESVLRSKVESPAKRRIAVARAIGIAIPSCDPNTPQFTPFRMNGVKGPFKFMCKQSVCRAP